VGRALLIVLVVLLLAGCGGEEVVSPTGSVEGTLPKAQAANPAAGKEVFASNGCESCHTFKPAGAGGKIGPDLDTALDGKDAEFIRTSITDPGAFIEKGYQDLMPHTYGSQLTSQQLNDLVAFLQTG
jgi:mono/diheme cytochrome c family protein